MGVGRIISLIREMLKVSKTDPAFVKNLQMQRFRTMIKHAATHSPFYKKLYEGIDLDICEVTDLPIVTKQMMMDNFDEFVTDPVLKRSELRTWLKEKNNLGVLYKGKYIPFQTSGTTGENALIVYDQKAMDTVHATVIARHAHDWEPTPWIQLKLFLGNLMIRKGRIASVLMTGGPYPAYAVALFTPKFHHLFVKTQVFSLLDPIDELVKKLNEFQPDNMFSYPSLLEILAREQIAGRLNISFGLPTSMIATGSEPLAETTKALAKKAWGMGIQDTYGTSECFIMARSCYKHDRMHVMSDLCLLEVVDRFNNPVPDGQVGNKILITNLFNELQPFIRYEVSDVAGYSTEPCGCSSPFPTLMRVEGRTEDIFYIDRDDGGYEPVHPYLFLGPIVELDEVREYQLVQNGRNEVTFNFVPISDDPKIVENIQRVLEIGIENARLTGRVKLRLERMEAIPRDERSGKFRQIRSLVGIPNDLEESDRMNH